VEQKQQKQGVQEREGGTGESLEIVNSLDNARIKRNNLFRLTLMEVGEVDGGCTRCTGSAEGSQECVLKGIPVVPVVAAAFQSIKPAESSAAEGIKDEGHRLIGRPSRGRA
jgi:hypothetical protein